LSHRVGCATLPHDPKWGTREPKIEGGWNGENKLVFKEWISGGRCEKGKGMCTKSEKGKKSIERSPDE